MAASQVRNIACLLDDMVQEYAAKTSALHRMVSEDSPTPLFDNNIDASHVVLPLLLRAQLEIVVQANNTAVEVSAIMPRRIETLDSEGLRLNRHEQRAADSSEPYPRRAGSEWGACQGRQQTAQHRPETRHAETVLRARG